MQRKYWLRITMVIMLLAGSFLVLRSTAGQPGVDESTCSQKPAGCPKSNPAPTSGGDMLWEGFSRQFISSINLAR